ncbi:hypothetical protein LN042_27340 [Kitasatospora sp. RB6PN24]|uniref:hypothetical protein n=1 Tax=Kitasatospora humi TaxID=2893891 RepID=UPI001E4FCF9A|nr:hypothetical protein [Kitasatospora humi]MCC9310739.1 hypothetical protein [Kitasatospora humi]
MAVEERTAVAPGEGRSEGTDPEAGDATAAPRAAVRAVAGGLFLLDRLQRMRAAGYWTTPRRVRALTAAVLAALLLVIGLTASLLTGARDGVDEIGHRTAPQAERAADLYFALSDMDAQAANLLLVGSDAQHTGQRDGAHAGYEQRRAQADSDLEQATEAVGGSTAARRAARDELDALGQYEGLVARMDEQEGTAEAAPGRPPAAALDTYRQATDLLRSKLLPGADQVAESNAATVDQRYAQERSALGDGFWELLGSGLLALVVLAVLQRTLAVRYRRLVSPPLLLAAVLTLAGTVWAVTLTSGTSDRLHTAKADAYDSVLALGRARAVAYDSNADESRWLLDPERASRYQQSFLDKSQQIVGFDGLADYSGYLPKLSAAVDAHHSSAAAVDFHGYLGDELRNITFPGEQQAADKLLDDYQTYQQDDAELRDLDRQGRLADAIAFDTGTHQGQSDGDFTALSNDFDRVVGINQQAFDHAVGQSDDELGAGSAVGLGVLGAGALVLVVLAVRPRLREYR